MTTPQEMVEAVNRVREAAMKYAEGCNSVYRISLLGGLKAAVKYARSKEIPEEVITKIILDEFLMGEEIGNG